MEIVIGSMYCVVFPQALCGGWGKRLAGVHMSLVIVPHPGEVFPGELVKFLWIFEKL